jgi:glypican 4 (K-glypican)
MNPYTNTTHAILLELRQQLITRAMRFDEHFRGILSQSKLSLNSMFASTYGLMYERNVEIFTNMYDNLEQYYATGRVHLTKSMDSFFQQLYQKIFQVANSNRLFTSSYLECLTEQLTILKPFKDAPDKLIVDIRHALVAARTFHQALNSAIDIIKSIISVSNLLQFARLWPNFDLLNY